MWIVNEMGKLLLLAGDSLHGLGKFVYTVPYRLNIYIAQTKIHDSPPPILTIFYPL